MNSLFRLSSLVLLMAVGLVTTSQANAQYYPSFNNPYAMNPYSQMSAYPAGIYNPNLYSPLSFYSTYSNNYSYVNPVTGIPYNYNFSYQYSGFAPYVPGATNRYNAPASYNSTPYYNQSANSYESPSRNPIVEQRLRVMKMAGRAPVQPMKKPAAEAAMQPVPQALPGKPGNNPEEIDAATVEANLPNPSDDALMSGTALNQLAQAIVPLHNEQPKMSGPFITSSVLEDVHFQGSDAAIALMLFSKYGTELSKPFLKSENIAARVALKEPISEFKTAYGTGKVIPSATIDNMAKGIGFAQTALDQSKSPEVDEMRQYLDHLKKLVAFAQTPEGRGAYNPKWFSIGVSVNDLLSYMSQYKTEFAAGDATARNEYRLLYRAMLEYYVKLKRAG